MPQVRFTNAWLQSIKPDPTKGIWYSESGGKNLRLYVGISGKKTWYINYRRPGEEKLYQHKIGDADLFSVSMARESALKFLASVAQGETPWAKQGGATEKPTLRILMEEFYIPWAKTAGKNFEYQHYMIFHYFVAFLDISIEDIDILKIERWRNQRKCEGVKNATINRPVTILKAVLNWAVKREILYESSLRRLEQLRESDSDTKIRYFSTEERERFDTALEAREERIRQERDNHNVWLAERGEPLFPDLRKCAFADYLKPMVIVSLNTGMRRGSLFKLLWSDIDFQEGGLMIRAAIAKGKKDIHIPMNLTLTKTLSAWKEQTGRDGHELIFPSPKTGGVMDNCRKTWTALLEAADIKNFRWHDMRHDFASQLVMKGVDLNTVRELMGHSDLKMTLRYAHLAPKVKRAAVEMLG